MAGVGSPDLFVCGHAKDKANSIVRADRKGHKLQCKTCKTASTKRWLLANPAHTKGVTRRVRLKKTDHLLIAQSGLCEICERQLRHPYLDHNHKCCQVATTGCPKCRRGLLCSDCNTKLAALEKPGWIDKARAYLDKWDSFFNTTDIVGAGKKSRA